MSDLVSMQKKKTQCFIYYLKKLATERPVTKTLIEYNSNN